MMLFYYALLIVSAIILLMLIIVFIANVGRIDAEQRQKAYTQMPDYLTTDNRDYERVLRATGPQVKLTRAEYKRLVNASRNVVHNPYRWARR